MEADVLMMFGIPLKGSAPPRVVQMVLFEATQNDAGYWNVKGKVEVRMVLLPHQQPHRARRRVHRIPVQHHVPNRSKGFCGGYSGTG